ncbi:hypothetical protein Ccrd_003083 [Cynara cardunculus var. scolymus]|uniref:Uncharacterized protein n=1 Tax=Cynara cardunculus var. scolymus TaxID=59895 RepID=A0A103XQE0_CYNCS|nr:hypothetical protein Ccrd_003083 [Cynara cardunculus var. scolymus]
MGKIAQVDGMDRVLISAAFLGNSVKLSVRSETNNIINMTGIDFSWFSQSINISHGGRDPSVITNPQAEVSYDNMNSPISSFCSLLGFEKAKEYQLDNQSFAKESDLFGSSIQDYQY